MKNHNKAFGIALRELRKQKKLSQEVLALQCSLDRTYISLLELGTNSPTLDTIVILCDGLGITLVELATLISVHLEKNES